MFLVYALRRSILINPELTKIIAFFMVFFQRLSTIAAFDTMAE